MELDRLTGGKCFSKINVSGGRVHIGDSFSLRDKDQEARKQLLASLRFDGMKARSNQIRDAHDETFEWIYDDSLKRPWDSFRDWLEKGTGIYWINGKAGSGKSTLMRFLAQNRRTKEALSKWSGSEDTINLSFYFWLSGNPLQRSEKGLYCSLLHDLITLSDALCDQLIKNDNSLTQKFSVDDWHINELRESLVSLIKLHKQHVLLFLDGLDEFDQDLSINGIFSFINTLIPEPSIKFCISSRPENALERKFKSCQQLRLQDFTSHDIKKLIVDTLAAEKYIDYITDVGSLHDNIRKLIELIEEKADGVFLWVHLVLKDIATALEKEDSISTLIRRVERLPKGMQELYEHMWLRNNGDIEFYAQEASLLFHLANIDYAVYLFDAAFALDEETRKSCLATLKGLDKRELLSKLDQTERKVRIRTLGLLEFVEVDKSYLGLESDTGPGWSLTADPDLVHLASLQMMYIHRSARDYLLTSVQGQQILDQVKFPQNQTLQLLVQTILSAIVHDVRIISRLHELDRLLSLVTDHSQFQTVEKICKNQSDNNENWIQRTKQMYEYHTFDFVGAVARCCSPQSLPYLDSVPVSQYSAYYKGYLLSLSVRNSDLVSWLVQQGADLFTPQCVHKAWYEPYMLTEPPIVPVLVHIPRYGSKKYSQLLNLLQTCISVRENDLHVCVAFSRESFWKPYHLVYLREGEPFIVLRMRVDLLICLIFALIPAPEQANNHFRTARRRFEEVEVVAAASNKISFYFKPNESSAKEILRSLEAYYSSVVSCEPGWSSQQKAHEITRSVAHASSDALSQKQKLKDLLPEDNLLEISATFDDETSFDVLPFDPFEHIDLHNWRERGSLREYFKKRDDKTKLLPSKLSG